MRIISGKAKGLLLEVPKSEVRPTTDRVREALFSILNQYLEGAEVLDLFAGSGALGIEALSRGARSAKFVDLSKYSCAAVSKNLQRAQLKGGQVVQSDVLSFVQKEAKGYKQYDLIFADPPYCKSALDRDFVCELLEGEALEQLLKPEGIFVGEAESGWGMAGAELPDFERWELLVRREYGKNTLFFFKKRKKIEA